MYAFLLVVTVLVGNNSPVNFYHTSHQRFSNISECVAQGVKTGDSWLAKFATYKKKPNVKTSVSCERQTTYKI